MRGQVQAAFAEDRLWVSAIMLRLPVRQWVARSEALSRLRFLPVDSAIDMRAVELAGLHPDPADRMIVASTEWLGAVLVTRDERLLAYGGIPTAWDYDRFGRRTTVITMS